MVLKWLALSPHSMKVLVFDSLAGVFLSLHALPVPVWAPSRCSGLLPQSKHMHVRLISDFKLPVGVSESLIVKGWKEQTVFCDVTAWCQQGAGMPLS